MGHTIQIRDVKTGQVFKVPSTENKWHVITKDGVKVRVHPPAISLLVKRGTIFGGITLTGTRDMERL